MATESTTNFEQYPCGVAHTQFMKQCNRQFFYSSTSPPGQGEFHKLSYYECGNISSSHKILCVHGLTRNALDFIPFCNSLINGKKIDAHILCLDVVGRGQSDKLTNALNYNYDQYVRDCTTWIAHIMGRNLQTQLTANNNESKDDVKENDKQIKITWCGTSMGGLIGMFLCSMKQSPIDQLIINDVGPLILGKFMDRIAGYVGKNPVISSVDELVKNIKLRYEKPFGKMMKDEEDWKFFAINSSNYDDQQKGYKLAYDERIIEYIQTGAEEDGKFKDIDLFSVFNLIDTDKIEMMLIQGEESDLLTNDIVEKMRKAKDKMKLLVVPECGHHPRLNTKLEIDSLYEFMVRK